MSKVYTRRGDKGETDLPGRGRVRKDHAGIEAVGAVDAAVTAVGAALVEVRREVDPSPQRDSMLDMLSRSQDALLRLASRMSLAGGPGVGRDDVLALESYIDEVTSRLPALHNFLIPGSTRAESALHQARTAVRAAERRAVTLETDTGALIYLNRLSDALFCMARHCLELQGETERVWKGNG